jgi:protein-S-isoprenylcysteine O-methyltransferase Ste14
MIIVKRAELTHAPEPRNGAWSTPSGWLRGRVMLVVRRPEVTAMGHAESPEPQPPRPAGIPRWLAIALAPIVGLVGFPAVHAGIPWALSHLGPRYGWADGGPAGWNLLGYAPVAVGAVLLVWIMVFGFTQLRDLPERVPMDWSPAILMTGGPYAISRHPMYVGELALWLGWAILYGSIPVLIGFAALGAVVARLAPREERALDAKFGDVYRQYKARVPRWLGVARRDRVPAEPGAAPDRRGS